jgi:hypothetical protein
MFRRFLISEWLYRTLLYLYPKEFRAVYGQQMCLAFRDAYRAAYHKKGFGGLLTLWLPTLFDLFKTALEERARQGEIIMSKTRLISLAGPLTILVGAIWLVEMIGDLLLRVGQVKEERFWDVFLSVWSFAFLISFIPLLFALMGMRLRFLRSASTLGRLGLSLSVIGGAGVIVSMLARLLWGGGSTRAGSRGDSLDRLRGSGLFLEHLDRLHSFRHRCPAIQTAAPLEPAAGSIGGNDFAQFRVRMVWCARGHAITMGIPHTLHFHQRCLLVAAWYFDHEPDTGIGAYSNDLTRDGRSE